VVAVSSFSLGVTPMRTGRCATENANPSPTSLLFLDTARLRGRKLLIDRRFGVNRGSVDAVIHKCG